MIMSDITKSIVKIPTYCARECTLMQVNLFYYDSSIPFEEFIVH